jgi:hypothetical protein
VLPVEYEGSRYLVSAVGESDWVRNLRAAGTAELAAKGKAPQPFRATEISAAERPPRSSRFTGG